MEEGSAMGFLVRKLLGLKKLVISWKNKKKEDLQMELMDIEEHIDNIFQFNCVGVFSHDELDLFGKLKKNEANILNFEEES